MSQDFVSEKEEELIGGLKNAVNRGETLDIACVSFINAGYPENVVRMAANRLSQNSGSPTVQEVNISKVNIPSSNLGLYAQRQNQVQNQNYSSQPKTYSRSPVPYWVIILMLLISLGIIIGAGVLGLYWHKLFPAY
jgi:hypothetical protein